MSAPVQTFVSVEPAALLETVRERQLEGCRLVQICCTKLEHFELTYSFARDGVFTHVRIHGPRCHRQGAQHQPDFQRLLCLRERDPRSLRALVPGAQHRLPGQVL